VLGEFSGDVNTVGIVGIAPMRWSARARMERSAPPRPSTRQRRGCAPATSSCSRCIARSALRLRIAHDQRGYIAVEWWPDDFAAILNATSRGIIVVEAAATAPRTSDDALYQTPAPAFPRLAQFVPALESRFGRHRRRSRRASAGNAWPRQRPDRLASISRTGARSIDAQGWGREVTTCGYGDLQGGSNEDLWYTDTFSGTSSASPIVTGVIACIQARRRRAASRC
jgi:hypothetical protein